MSLRGFSSYLQNKSTGSWSEWALGAGKRASSSARALLGMGRGSQTATSHPGVSQGCSRASSSSSAWFCREPAFLEQQAPGKVLEQVWDSLRERPRDWRDCVRWARRRWQSCYHDDIVQLLHIYPPEHVSPSGWHPLHPLPSTSHLAVAWGTHSWA